MDTTNMKRRKLFLLLLMFIGLWCTVHYLYTVSAGLPEEPGNRRYEDHIEILEQKIEHFVQGNRRLVKDVASHLSSAKANFLVDKIRLLNSGYNADSKEKLSEPRDNLNTKVNNKVEQSLPEPKEPSKEFRPSKEISNDLIQNASSEIPEFAPRTTLEDGRPVIAIILFSCNRVTVKRCLDRLLKLRPSKEQFPIIVSQDCVHKATTDVILSYGDQIHFIRQPDQSDIAVPPKEKKFKGYFKIARHYGWALNQIFFTYKYSTAIVVEDDLDVSDDFYEYFLGTYWLLHADPTLWCVSAWNDNGKEELVDIHQPQLLYRTDFFPGLGWMLTNKLWTELSPKWPASYWDDWMRKPEQTNGRACIRPEISRTKTFGKVGVSNGMFFEKHLKYIRLNEEFVGFTQMNLTYLLRDSYDLKFVDDIFACPAVTLDEVKSGKSNNKEPVRISYTGKDDFKRAAKSLGLMDDFRSGVARTAYRGIVTCMYKGQRVYLAPEQPWGGYDPTWN